MNKNITVKEKNESAKITQNELSRAYFFLVMHPITQYLTFPLNSYFAT